MREWYSYTPNISSRTKLIQISNHIDEHEDIITSEIHQTKEGKNQGFCSCER